MNRVEVDGMVTDVRKGDYKSGGQWASCMLCHNVERQNGEDQAEHYDVKATGDNAKLLTQGARVKITGRLREDTWPATDRYKAGRRMVVFAKTVELLSTAPAAVPESDKPVAAAPTGENGEFGEDDTPF